MSSSAHDFNANAYYAARAKLLDLFGSEVFEHSQGVNLPSDDCDTPFAVGPASLAVWEALRGFSWQKDKIAVNPDLALLSLRQERYLHVNDAKPSLWDEFSSVYECADGSLVQLHCNFPGHRDAALVALNHPKNLAEAKERAKILFKTAEDLEKRVLELKGAAAAVRPLVHRAKQLTPLVEIIPVPQRARSLKPGASNRPFNIIDLTRVLAGPVSTRVLKEVLGSQADVLTVTSPSLPQIEPARLLLSLGKRSAYCDFTNDEDLAAFKALASECDVFVQSFRERALDRYELGDEDFFKIAPQGAVKVNIRAYEMDRERRGFDSLVQCHTGMFSTHSTFVNKAEHLPVQALDHLTGMLAALGALVALKRRNGNPSMGYIVNVSLERTARFLIDELPMRASARVRQPNGLESIEARAIPVVTRTKQGKTMKVRYLKGVLAGHEREETDTFVESAGSSSLKWLN